MACPAPRPRAHAGESRHLGRSPRLEVRGDDQVALERTRERVGAPLPCARRRGDPPCASSERSWRSSAQSRNEACSFVMTISVQTSQSPQRSRTHHCESSTVPQSRGHMSSPSQQGHLKISAPGRPLRRDVGERRCQAAESPDGEGDGVCQGADRACRPFDTRARRSAIRVRSATRARSCPHDATGDRRHDCRSVETYGWTAVPSADESGLARRDDEGTNREPGASHALPDRRRPRAP